MKRILLFLILLFSISLFAQNHRGNKELYDQSDYSVRKLKNKISRNLKILEREYLTKLSYRDYIRAKDLLIDSYNMLMLINDEDEYTNEEPYAMNDSEFSALVDAVKNESFESDMLSIVQISAKYNYYTVSQVVRLIDLFSFSNGKMEVVKLTYPNVIDKFNSHHIINAFAYSSDKEKVREIIASFPER